MTPAALELRPHHLLCLLAFIGRGYSPGFVARMRELQRRYLDPSMTIRLVEGPDDACRACPELEAAGCGRDDAGVRVLDRRVLAATGLTPGIHTAGALHRTLARTFAAVDPGEVCGACSWRDLVDCPALIRRRLEALRPQPAPDAR